MQSGLNLFILQVFQGFQTSWLYYLNDKHIFSFFPQIQNELVLTFIE